MSEHRSGPPSRATQVAITSLFDESKMLAYLLSLQSGLDQRLLPPVTLSQPHFPRSPLGVRGPAFSIRAVCVNSLPGIKISRKNLSLIVGLRKVMSGQQEYRCLAAVENTSYFRDQNHRGKESRIRPKIPARHLQCRWPNRGVTSLRGFH